MTVKEWLREASARLSVAGIEGARLEAQVLAAHVLLVDRSWLVAHEDAEFPDLAGENLLQRRERHEPLAYILGKREFYGRPFVVRPGVLIPRQETEILVETALAAMSGALSVLDIGVGSGAIAITLKLERPAASVIGVDVSDLALEIAAQNADLLGADIGLILSDVFEELGSDQFDVIVSNPPYIGLSEPLAAEVSGHEPHLALFSGSTGLEFYERLAREASGRLRPGGRIISEVGHTQAGAVRGLFEAQGWVWRQTVRDLSGIDRVVEFGRIP